MTRVTPVARPNEPPPLPDQRFHFGYYYTHFFYTLEATHSLLTIKITAYCSLPTTGYLLVMTYT